MNYQLNQIWINHYGTPDKLEPKTCQKNFHLKEEDVLIACEYSGINFADIIMRQGLYQDAPKRPFIPGYEVSGTVIETGPKVSKFKAGDKVMAGTRFGGYQSYVQVEQEQVVKVPSNWDLKQACALPVNYITAYLLVDQIGRVKAGEKVLIDCATGGVGNHLLQMLQKIGAEAYGLTTSPHKKQFIENLGGKAFLFSEMDQIKDIKFNFVINSSGGKSLAEQYDMLDIGGHICSFGVQSAISGGKRNFLKLIKTVLSTPKFSILKLINDNKTVSGLNALYYFDNKEWMEKHLNQLNNPITTSHIDKIFSYQEISQAHQYIEDRKAKGKVLIQWN